MAKYRCSDYTTCWVTMKTLKSVAAYKDIKRIKIALACIFRPRDCPGSLLGS
jgi:hypothetical protein